MHLKIGLLFLCVCLFSIANTASLVRNISDDKIEHMISNIENVVEHDSTVTSESQHNKPDTHDKNVDSEKPHERKATTSHNPSYQLQKSKVDFKPDTFKLWMKIKSISKTSVYFEYKQQETPYDQYTFQIRFFGHYNYITQKKVINTTGGVNELIFHDFLEDKYIVCVAFYSSNNSVPPLSTSDMCIDLLIGESNHEEHNFTGLLSPLLLAVATFLLISIAIVDYLKKVWKRYKTRKYDEKKAKSGRKMTLAEKTKRRMSNIPMSQSGLISRNDLSEVFLQVDRRGSIWEDRVQGRLVRVSDPIKEGSNSFNNEAFDQNEYDHEYKHSLDTFNHLLSTKPWIFRADIDEQTINRKENRPQFF